MTVTDPVLPVVEEKNRISGSMQCRNHIQKAAPIRAPAVNGNDGCGSTRVTGNVPTTKRLVVDGWEFHGFERDIEIMQRVSGALPWQ